MRTSLSTCSPTRPGPRADEDEDPHRLWDDPSASKRLEHLALVVLVTLDVPADPHPRRIELDRRRRRPQRGPPP